MKKIKVIANSKKDYAKSKILQAMLNDWERKNPGILEDINKLSVELALFNAKWGTDIQARDLHV